MSYLLDTNVVSEWTKPRPSPGVTRFLASVDESTVFLSLITVAELEHGIAALASGTRRDRLAAWLENDLLARFGGRILGIDLPVCRDWGLLMARRQRQGRPLGAMDAFVAATARVHGLTLVTRNEADFAGADVSLFNPWKV